MSNYTKIERSFKYWTRTDLADILGLKPKKKKISLFRKLAKDGIRFFA